MNVELVPSSAPVSLSATAALRHRCPYRAEVDRGDITITWTVAGKTIELHSLRAYLDGFNDAVLSHEEITDRIFHDLAVEPGIEVESVVTTWRTADMEVRVEVLRDALKPEGA